MTCAEVSNESGLRDRLIDRLQRSARLSRRQEYVGVGLLWVVVTGWVWARLTQGWVGIDDGAFAQIATRVLEGQLPHREFADVYTGGMTFMNAATMYVFGEDIVVLRYPLFVAFLGLVPAAYYIARSVTGPWTALLAAALVCTWSVPVYPAPMPSWYLLMFSVYSAACLIRWRAIRSSRWLLSAGLLAGLAVAFKITGVYLVVAVLLFLVFVHPKQPRVGRSVGLDWPSIGAVALVGGLLASVLGSRLGSSELVNLALPVAAIALVVVVERRRGSPTELGSVAGTTLRRSVLLFLTGVGLPLVALLVPYLLAGAVGDLVEGVFVSPQSRRDTAYWRTPAPASVVFALALAALVFARGRLSRPGRLIVDVGLTAAAFGALLVAADDQSAYLAYWVTGRGMGTVIVVIGAAVLLRRWRSVEIERREILFLLLALAALTTLVQFPFGIPLYYCYAAPLVALAAVAVVSRSRTGRVAHLRAGRCVCALRRGVPRSRLVQHSRQQIRSGRAGNGSG